MSIGSISSTPSTIPAKPVQRMPEASEIKGAGRDNDGDQDDGGAKVTRAKPALTPTVNTSGQKLGQVINVTA